MMDFSMKIDCSDDALSDGCGGVSTEALGTLIGEWASRMRRGFYLRIALGTEGKIYDSNGNHVGQWILQ